MNSASGAVVGKVKVKAFDMATGPFHYDYGLENSNGRIFFDIKMSQIVKIVMKPLHVSATFKDVLAAPTYSYNFNVVVD